MFPYKILTMFFCVGDSLAEKTEKGKWERIRDERQKQGKEQRYSQRKKGKNKRKLTETERKVNAGDSVGSLSVSDLKYTLTETSSLSCVHTHTRTRTHTVCIEAELVARGPSGRRRRTNDTLHTVSAAQTLCQRPRRSRPLSRAGGHVTKETPQQTATVLT